MKNLQGVYYTDSVLSKYNSKWKGGSDSDNGIDLVPYEEEELYYDHICSRENTRWKMTPSQWTHLGGAVVRREQLEEVDFTQPVMKPKSIEKKNPKLWTKFFLKV